MAEQGIPVVGWILNKMIGSRNDRFVKRYTSKAEQINALHREGTTLSDPNVWDGQLAAQFRSDWSQMNTTLNQLKEQLAQLQAQIDTINQNIMSAGGNA